MHGDGQARQSQRRWPPGLCTSQPAGPTCTCQPAGAHVLGRSICSEQSACLNRRRSDISKDQSRKVFYRCRCLRYWFPFGFQRWRAGARKGVVAGTPAVPTPDTCTGFPSSLLFVSLFSPCESAAHSLPASWRHIYRGSLGVTIPASGHGTSVATKSKYVDCGESVL